MVLGHMSLEHFYCQKNNEILHTHTHTHTMMLGGDVKGTQKQIERGPIAKAGIISATK